MSNHKSVFNGSDQDNRSTFGTKQQIGDRPVLVKVSNDWWDDILRENFVGRTTGFTGGYTDNISNAGWSSVLPGLSGGATVTLPPAGGLTSAAFIASSSVQDTSTGTGCASMIIFYMTVDLEVLFEIVALNGQTPVRLNVSGQYHFMYGFVYSPGSGYLPLSQVTSNVGTIWVGNGTFSSTTGFATKFMIGNPLYGFVTSGVYVVPKGKRAFVKTVKYNSDSTVSTVFRLMARPSRQTIWSMGASDVVHTTLAIERSIAGTGVAAGGEYTVLGQKTVNSGTIQANFVLTMHEILDTYINS